MSDQTDTDRADAVRDEVQTFLRRNFPQIQMHGGSAAVEQVDVDEGTVHIRLGGACSGCGISPMTIQAIKNRLTDKVDAIDTVYAATGSTTMTSAAGGRGAGGLPADVVEESDETDDSTSEFPF